MGNSKNNKEKVPEIEKFYFKETYKHLLYLKEENIPLDKIFTNIENFVKEECGAITTTQLRNIYAKIIPIKDIASLKMLRPNLAYIAARQSGNNQDKAKNVIMFFDQLIQEVKEIENLDSFKKIMESIVAYHKYHHNKK